MLSRGPSSAFVIAVLGILLAGPRGASARDDDACPKEDGCTEACELAEAPAETPSPTFLSKLRSIGSAGQRIDPAVGASLVERRAWLGVLNVAGLSPEDARPWEVAGRYAGPCTGLVVVFWSRAVDAHNKKNAIDLYELRYRTEAEAKRVVALMTDGQRPWDWNYRPFAAIHSGRSAFVVEGRHHARPAFRRVAEHFGWKPAGPDDGPSVRSCDPETETKPLVEVTDGDGARAPVSLFAMGFSASGRFAWLEQRHGSKGTDLEWSVHVTDLVNDSKLATESFQVHRKGLIGLCARHGRDLAHLLADHRIQTPTVPALEPPKANKDQVAVETRRATADADNGRVTYDVILHARAGSKRIASIEQDQAPPGANPAGPPKILGIVRSPFESRVAVGVLQEVVGSGGGRVTRVQFFGGRLDKGFTPDPAR
jgi:hypothetical protein